MLYSKSPNEHLKVTLSWTAELAIDTATIASVTWTVPSGITQVSASSAGSNTTIVLSGGTSGVEYSVKCRIATSASTYYEQGVIVKVTDSLSQPSNCYVSVFDVASDLGLTTEADLSRLTQIANSVSRWVEDYTGRKFYTQTDVVEFIPARDKYHLYLAHAPLQSITSIAYDGETVDAADYTIAGYETSTVRAVDTTWGLYAESSDNYYTVTYTAGFVLPGQVGRNLPYDIELACSMVLKEAWKSKGADPRISKMSIPQVVTLEYGNAQNFRSAKYQASQLLDKYKIWRF